MEWQTVLLRLLASALAGGIIGFERERHRRAAGLRTHILVCIGSTLFMITSVGIGIFFQSEGTVDHARIAAGVVTGIGFLGAGAIIRYGSSIKGLTTAASIWSVAAIGLAMGMGMYVPAFLGTAIIFAVLMLSRLEEEIQIRRQKKSLMVATKDPCQASIPKVTEKIISLGGTVSKFFLEKKSEGDGTFFVFEVVIPEEKRDLVISELINADGIEEVCWK